ncbi:MAG: FkbM family methyltransferase [Pseudomonadota bacterium]
MTAPLAELASALSPERRLRIVDVGANPINEPPYGALIDAGVAEVIGFEPQREAFEALQKVAPTHARFIHGAVGTGGEATFHSWPNAPGMASLFPFRKASARYLGRFRGLAGNERKAQITTRTLDEIEEIESIDVLKIDVQGSERDIIEAGERKLEGAIAVITEMRFYALYEGEPALWELDLELRRQGFVLHRFLPIARALLPSRYVSHLSRGARTQLIDGDAVYIKPLERLAEWTDEALIRMALAAAGAFQSYDMALMILAQLEDRGRITQAAIERFIATIPAKLRAEEAVTP